METKEQKLQQLKSQLSSQLLNDQYVAAPQGVPTGIQQLDEFLFWQGFPKNGISLINAAPGLGATSFWLRAAREVSHSARWSAWINISEEKAVHNREDDFGLSSRRKAEGVQKVLQGRSNKEIKPKASSLLLNPLPLWQQQIDLSRLLVVQSPLDSKKVFFSLQEVMSCELFDLIGCDLSTVQLKRYQLERLQRLSRKHKTALILHNSQGHRYSPQLFSMILKLESKKITINRALYRPTPHFIRRIEYANFMSQLTQGMQGISSRGFSQVQPLRTVS